MPPVQLPWDQEHGIRSRTAAMPYEVSFTKRVPIRDRDDYINDCCVGGDAVRDRLLPAVQARYGEVDTNQEDWGWFIWFRKGHVSLAIDVFTDDPEEGVFRIHLTSRTKRLLVFDASSTRRSSRSFER